MLLTVRRAVAPIVAAACMGCSEPLTPGECGALLDQYVTVLAQSDRPGTTEPELLKLKAQGRERAARDPAFRECSERVSRRQFECAMTAENTDRFEQCLL